MHKYSSACVSTGRNILLHLMPVTIKNPLRYPQTQTDECLQQRTHKLTRAHIAQACRDMYSLRYKFAHINVTTQAHRHTHRHICTCVCTHRHAFKYLGFPGGSAVKNHQQGRRCRFDPWVGKNPWRRKWQPTPVFLPGESHGQRSLAGYSPWGRKESDTT